MLELDHVFCMVADPVDAARRLEDDGWVLDAGQAHRGQGTRNRRLALGAQFFELLWVTDEAEVRANPLRLDRRAAWTTTGASPVGLGFRGRVGRAEGEEYWLYDALGPRIWVHRDNERAPERPLVFVLEADDEAMRRRRRHAEGAAHGDRRELRHVAIRGPEPPSLPAFAGPPIVHAPGPHRLELVIAETGAARVVSETVVIRS
jgi:hypothetical protein